jgi:ABC-type multidrug transport system permease subunit
MKSKSKQEYRNSQQRIKKNKDANDKNEQKLFLIVNAIHAIVLFYHMNIILNYVNRTILLRTFLFLKNFFNINMMCFFSMYVYICIYDKRQREIEIEKTNEQKKEYKRNK